MLLRVCGWTNGPYGTHFMKCDDDTLMVPGKQLTGLPGYAR
jgi:hypothetical protein